MPSSTLPFFEWCGSTRLGLAVRDTVWAFPVIETFHLLALAVLLGTVLIVNLRIFGLGARYASAAQLSQDLEPWMLVSVAISVATGIPMMLSEPMKCYESYSFPIKMILLVVAIAFHFTVQRRSPTKPTAAISMALWAAIGLAGKGIPYL